MSVSKKLLVVLLGALVALSGVLSAPVAEAATPSYVALGDSYSSGLGTRSYLSDGTDCKRSVYAYPSLIAAAKGYALNFRACAGATVSDVTGSQLSALSSATDYVTISVGGNDAGFTSVLTECALPSWMSNCFGKISTAQGYITSTLPGRLATLYAAIRTRAPNASVTVVGYPRLFNGTDCDLFTWFSRSEETALNQTADLMNARLASAATAAGFAFANPTSRFIGHAVCDSPEWLNGLSYPVDESYHPNRTGQRSGYYPLVSSTVGGTSTLSAAIVRRAVASGRTLAAHQRAYAGLDASIDHQGFVAPDLTTARAKAAAARAGVNLASRASINRADRTYGARQAKAWLADR